MVRRVILLGLLVGASLVGMALFLELSLLLLNPTSPGAAATSAAAAGGASADTSVTTTILPGNLYLSSPKQFVGLSVTKASSGQTLARYSFTNAVHDNTGSGDGWHEVVSQTPFTKNGHSLGTSRVTRVRVGNAPNSTNTAPSGEISLPVALSSQPATILVAEQGSGMGNFIVTSTVTVVIPPNSALGSYTASLAVGLVQGP